MTAATLTADSLFTKAERLIGSSVGFHRIGAVSRQAGVPVSTLRVWEQRYGAFTPVKTQGSHRLYGETDLVRAQLMRSLTEQGHAISTIATLPLERLRAMNSRATSAAAISQRERTVPSAVVLGSPVALRLMNPALKHRWHGSALEVRHVVLDLDALEELAASQPQRVEPAADLAVVRLNTLDPALPVRLARVSELLRVQRTIVLYGFAAQATVDSLRSRGMLARREPVTAAACETPGAVRSLLSTCW